MSLGPLEWAEPVHFRDSPNTPASLSQEHPEDYSPQISKTTTAHQKSFSLQGLVRKREFLFLNPGLLLSCLHSPPQFHLPESSWGSLEVALGPPLSYSPDCRLNSLHASDLSTHSTSPHRGGRGKEGTSSFRQGAEPRELFYKIN